MVETNATALLSRAWQLVRHNPLVWMLGFIAALSGDLLSNIRIGPQLNLTGTGELLQANTLNITSWLRALRLMGASLVVAAAITALVAGFVLALVLSAKAALVKAACQPEQHNATERVSDSLRDGARPLASLVGVTIRIYAPFLLASQLAGEALHLAPGLLRLPLYAVLLILLVVGAAVPFIHAGAICSIVLEGSDSRQAVASGLQMVLGRGGEMLTILAALLAASLICTGLSQIVLQPITGVSLLSLLLTLLRGGIPNLGQVFGLLLLGGISTAIAAPAYVLTMVVMALASQPQHRWS